MMINTIPYSEEIAHAELKLLEWTEILFILDDLQEKAIESIVKLCLTGK